MHASRIANCRWKSIIVFHFAKSIVRMRDSKAVCLSYRPYSPYAALNKTCSQAGRERSRSTYLLGAFSVAHQQIAAGRSGGSSCKTSNCRNFLQYQTRSIKRWLFEEEPKFAAASAARREDVIRSGPVCADEGAVFRDEYRRTRRRNATELHKGPGGTAQRRFWALRWHDSRLHGEMSRTIPVRHCISAARAQN